MNKLMRCLCCAISMSVVLTLQPLNVTAATTAHSSSRDVQTEGVGNPFNYGERNTPANASVSEIKAINHEMSVQEVKYCLYKEIDEHWDLLSVRLGQTEREKVYALFAGLATRESTIGGNGNGGDLETAYESGFAVSTSHAYGPLQTAVTAFYESTGRFSPESDVPEMEQYVLNESNFYDCVTSVHMGIRKTVHFACVGMSTYRHTGTSVVRNALKGFNTGNASNGTESYYDGFSDEVCTLAQWYYYEGHLYDNSFTWTDDARASEYRTDSVWDWWGSTEPSLAEISSSVDGDIDLDGALTGNDAYQLKLWLMKNEPISAEALAAADIDNSGTVNIADYSLLIRMLTK